MNRAAVLIYAALCGAWCWCASPVAAERIVYAVAIGNNAPPASEPSLAALRYADDDAQGVGDAFAGQNGKLYGNVHTRVLTEASATLSAVLDGYESLLMRGRYPVAMLFLATAPGEIDVNVHPAKLEVRFAPAILSFLRSAWGDYWIIGLGPDYTWAVVGTPNREYLWILSRTPEMSAASYERALEIAKGNGFDVTRVVKTTNSGRAP